MRSRTQFHVNLKISFKYKFRINILRILQQFLSIVHYRSTAVTHSSVHCAFQPCTLLAMATPV